MLLATVWVAGASDFSSTTTGGTVLYYQFNSETTVSVCSPETSGWTGYTKPTGHLIIPATVNNGGIDYSVTAIASRAFFDCSGLTAIELPSSIVTIGLAAFYNCSALDTIILPSTLTTIGTRAFIGTSFWNNDDNWVDGMLCVGSYLVDSRSSLTGEVVVPEGIFGIANNTFYSRSTIDGITLPSTLHFIGDQAFSACTSLDTLRVLATVPPVLGHNVLVGTDTAANVTIIVPCESKAAYDADADWAAHTLITHCPPDDPHNPDDPDNPHNPDDPNNPDNPDNPDIPDNPVSTQDSLLTVTSVPGGLQIDAPDGSMVAVSDLAARNIYYYRSSGRTFVSLTVQGVYLVFDDQGHSVKAFYLKK